MLSHAKIFLMILYPLGKSSDSPKEKTWPTQTTNVLTWWWIMDSPSGVTKISYILLQNHTNANMQSKECWKKWINASGSSFNTLPTNKCQKETGKTIWPRFGCIGTWWPSHKASSMSSSLPSVFDGPAFAFFAGFAFSSINNFNSWIDAEMLLSCLVNAFSNDVSKLCVMECICFLTSSLTAANSFLTPRWKSWFCASRSSLCFCNCWIWDARSSILESWLLNRCSMGASTGLDAAFVLRTTVGATCTADAPPLFPDMGLYCDHGSSCGFPVMKAFGFSRCTLGTLPAKIGDALIGRLLTTFLINMHCPFHVRKETSCTPSDPISHVFGPNALIGLAFQECSFSHSLTSWIVAAIGVGDTLYNNLTGTLSGQSSDGLKAFHDSSKCSCLNRIPLLIRMASPLGLAFLTNPMWLGWSTAVFDNSIGDWSNQMTMNLVSNELSSPLATMYTPFRPDCRNHCSNFPMGTRVWHWKLNALMGSLFPLVLIHERPQGGETIPALSSILRFSNAYRTGWSTIASHSHPTISSPKIVMEMMALDAIVTLSPVVALTFTCFAPRLCRQHCKITGWPFGPCALIWTGLHRFTSVEGHWCPKTRIANSSCEMTLKSESHGLAASQSNKATPATFGTISCLISHFDPSSFERQSGMTWKFSALMVSLGWKPFLTIACLTFLVISRSCLGNSGHLMWNDVANCFNASNFSSCFAIPKIRVIARIPALRTATSAKCDVCCNSAPFESRKTAMEFFASTRL